MKNKQEVALDMLMPVIREKLEMGGTVSLGASGNSMSPLFRHRKDTVSLEKTDGREVKKYDMILYQRPDGKYVLHRIVGVGADGYILRGDHQYADEYPVKPEWVIAKVTGFVRNGRRTECTNILYRMYAVCWVNTVSLRHWLFYGKSLPARGCRKICRTFWHLIRR